MNDLEQLAVLDPMRDYEPSPSRRARATAALEKVFHEPAPAPSRRFSFGDAAPARRSARRFVLSGAVVGLAAAVAVAGMIVLPGEHGDKAYAWTAKPQALAGADALPEAQRCAAGWGADWATPPTAADILLAERRGRATLALVRKDGTGLTACFVLDPAEGAAGGDLLDTATPQPVNGRARIETMGATEGKEGWYSDVIGRAGADVTKLEIELPDGTNVQASVRNGWWVAWWPGHEGGKADGVRVVVHTSSGSKSFLPSELGV
ncbi:hypothetical protein [Paractinoplanes lichenicola]|uniref:Uncharacterized protein n=1 Tax=Paractinoplanes lichenicola TaxID=2802976 RepID=A0ABS1VEC2_9ACTN|nr:hypothetical protein [Actinoplanes lichenicola]MBL7253023.1 hypothetical protein [Actinoplanes lichenicola]